jgi:hypothetical protein
VERCAHGGQASFRINELFFRASTDIEHVGVASHDRWQVMQRRQFLQVASLTAAATTVAKPAIAQSSPAIKWRLTASWPKSLDVAYGNM